MDGTLTNFSDFHLQLLEQPNLTNIQVDVEKHCEEVEDGLTTEDIVDLALPQALSPLYQEFLYFHNHLYQMPNHQMIQLPKQRVIPHRLSVLK